MSYPQRREFLAAAATITSLATLGGTQPAAAGDPSVRICEDVSKQIGANIQRELGKYQGSDFDRAYVGQQFWSHVIFVGAAKGAEKHVSQDLQQLLNQGATTGEKHLEHCRTLIRDLSANVARGASETTPRR
jgi:predicted outer membrane protein